MGGFIHAYGISPDWEIMGQISLSNLVGVRPVFAITFTGLVLVLSVQLATLIGGSFRLELLVIFLPIIVGASVGSLQVMVVSSALWEFD
jgi:hypothetical protein